VGSPGHDDLFSDPERHPMTAAKVNPFMNSFVIRNPAAPHLSAQQKFDPAWKTLNSGEPYSLLKNKQNYTLVVKVFTAPANYQSSINQPAQSNSIMAKLGFGNKPKDFLEATALQAQEWARYLRHLNFEAYVLHMRNGSLVTVGGFGSQEDAELLQMQQKLGAFRLNPQNVQMQDQNIDPLNDPLRLLPNPMPMEVPHL
jgi:hypothetical protein